MKKKLLAGILVSSSLLGLSSTVFAATSSGVTDADATFTAGDRPGPVQPEEGPNEPKPVDPDVDPEDPSKPKPLPETGNVYVTHLPNISFGSNKTELKTSEYEALTEKRTTGGGAESFFMPHSVQVADVSGNNETKWKLSVQQSDSFKTNDTTPSVLENTRIRIYGNTLTSSAYEATDLVDKLNGAALDQTDTVFGNHSIIPVTNAEGGDLTVLDNPTAGFTVNSYTSSVFSNDYLEENYTPELTPEAGKYTGVKLNVPASDQSQAKAYKAELTWTLTVEP